MWRVSHLLASNVASSRNCLLRALVACEAQVWKFHDLARVHQVNNKLDLLRSFPKIAPSVIRELRAA